MRQTDLNELATMNRIPRAVILREAVDDLLEKHRIIWSRSRDHGALLRDISGGPSKRKLRGELAPGPQQRQGRSAVVATEVGHLNVRP
jgi:hypothetical protein